MCIERMKMKIKTYEQCEFEINAVHSNPNPPVTADLEYMEHHHLFKFVCKKQLQALPLRWSANNFREDCESTIRDYFSDHSYGCLNFEKNDCIALAQLLMAKMNLDYCSVTEVGIGGIELVRESDIWAVPTTLTETLRHNSSGDIVRGLGEV